MRVLAVGVANAARSQLAEGWLRALSTPDLEVWSAGTRPGRLCPEAIAVMREVGIDLGAHRAKSLDEVPEPDVIVAVCEVEATGFSTDPEHLAWPVDDPDLTRGGWAERLAAFRRVRDGLYDHVDAFLRARGKRIAFGARARPMFALRPDMVFTNHGSFGATPKVVTDAQRRLQDEFESQPLAFVRALPARVRRVASSVASFLRADPQDLVFVDNATSGVTAVLRSLRLEPGDAIVVTNHAYGAVRAAVDHLCRRTGAVVVVAEVPFPLSSPDEVVEAVERALPDRARLAIFDAITSVTGLVFPVEALVDLCRARDVPVLVDAAHVPGHLPVDLSASGADYWVGNCHKWLFAPKGCAVLHVRRDRHDSLDPLAWSHGVGTTLTGAFDFQGTRDPTPWLATEAALAFVHRFGADRIRAHNALLRGRAGAALCEQLGVEPPAPAEMLGALQTLPLPFDLPPTRAAADALNARLWEQHRVEAMFVPFAGAVWLRIACQIYNDLADYERLGDVLLEQVP